MIDQMMGFYEKDMPAKQLIHINRKKCHKVRGFLKFTVKKGRQCMAFILKSSPSIIG
jgi:hypothetical protein